MRFKKRLFIALIVTLTPLGFIGVAILFQANSKVNTINSLTSRAQENALNFDYNAAIAAMSAAIELDPNNSQLHRQRGDMIMLIYEWDRALRDYNRAIELDSRNANAYFSRGIFWYTQVDREKAQRDFEQYLNLAPEGNHAEEVRKYLQNIESEIEALGG